MRKHYNTPINKYGAKAKVVPGPQAKSEQPDKNKTKLLKDTFYDEGTINVLHKESYTFLIEQRILEEQWCDSQVYYKRKFL